MEKQRKKTWKNKGKTNMEKQRKKKHGKKKGKKKRVQKRKWKKGKKKKKKKGKKKRKKVKNVNWLSCDHRVAIQTVVIISQFVIPRHEGKQSPPPGNEPGTCWLAVSRFNHWAMYPWDLCPDSILGALTEFSVDHQMNRRNIEPLQVLTCP